MHGLMMDYQLTIPAMLRHTEALFGHREIVSRLPDRSLHRYTYADCLRRARQLAAALGRLGVRRGDRVATLCWNHYRHLEAYYGVPSSGAVLHTLNLRLHPDDLAYVATHAGDRVLLVDQVLLPLYEKVRDRVPFEHVVVVTDGASAPEGMLEYEALLDSASGEGAGPGYEYPELDEREAAVMCYTSGTTGKSKGVLYSHRSLALHTLAAAMGGMMDLRDTDTNLAVVPMFHANAWGTPFTCALVGAKQVLPGPHLDAPSLLDLIRRERVTVACGVPTIWMNILQTLDADPGAYDVSTVRTMLIGGSAVPEAMIRAFQERHGLRVLHAWGMTETAPLGTVCTVPAELAGPPTDEQYRYRARQGTPAPFVEIRARGEDGELIPWDGTHMGELEVRGPWVASGYFQSPDSADRFTDDGWFRTGDVVSIEPRGCVTIRDRAKDLIKSGGEWISSVALENALMAHPDVAEAAVIAVPHPRWDERPLAAVVPRAGRSPSPDALLRFLEPQFSRWSLPDAIEFVPEIPRTSAGKFLKSALRERFKDYDMVAAAERLKGVSAPAGPNAASGERAAR